MDGSRAGWHPLGRGSPDEAGLTEVDAPQPLLGVRSHGSLEDRQEEEREQERESVRHSLEHRRRESLSELVAPPPVDERGPRPGDEESGFSPDEDLETRRLSEREEREERGGEKPGLVDQANSDQDDDNGKISSKGNGSNGNKTTSIEKTNKYSPFLTDLYIISWLIFFSFWGTLARMGLEAITLYPNSPFTSRVLWANLGGSFIMGFLVEDRRIFRHEWGTAPSSTSSSTTVAGSPPPPKDRKAERKAASAAHLKVKKTIPLYIGLSTGFCGCFTSFSSFMRDAFLAMSNHLEPPSDTTPFAVNTVIYHRNGGFSFLALMAVFIVHTAISLTALSAGAHFALFVHPITPSLPFHFVRKVFDPLAVLLGFGCWLGAVFLAIWPPGDPTHWRYRAVMPLIFSPVGCLIRFYASKYLNVYIPSFPLGTFSVNMFGTAVLGMAWDLQHASGIGAGSTMGILNACSVLEGIQEGFCGCLSTVSTWVLELDGLKRKHAWIYGVASVGLGFSLMVVIMGSMAWTIGFSEPKCN